MRFRFLSFLSLAAGLCLLAAAPQAWAQPDLSGTDIINEDDGFSGVCAAPCFVVQKDFSVFFDGNPTSPGVCPAGNNTYIYTLTHLGNPPSTLAAPGIPIDRFTLTVDSAVVTAAGFIPGAGVAPVSTTINPATVSWDFPQSGACPGCLDQGKVSEKLFICSPAPPAVRPDIVTTTAIVLDAPGQCTVPVQPQCDIDVDKKCCVASGDDNEDTDSDSASSDERPGDECAEDDDDSDSDNSDFTGTPFTDSCTAHSGDTVVYQYTLTNGNAAGLSNVVLDDDQLGQIASGVSIPAGGSKTFMAHTTVFSTTTNTADATGDLATGGSCVGADSVTVTVN